MNASPEKTEPTTETIRPPQLIQSLVGGFNAVANNISLILLPVALDVLLWLGPHVRIKKLFEPGLAEMLNYMRTRGAPESRAMVDSLESMTAIFLERYNLLSTLNTFPVGLPSQMAGLSPIESPAGTPPGIEIGSYLQFVLGWLLLVMLGIILGSVYYALVARSCEQSTRQIPAGAPTTSPAGAETAFAPNLKPSTLGWQVLQVVALLVILTCILLVLLAPTLVVAVLLGLFSAVVAQFALMLMVFVILWLLIPLVFSPHGIFLRGQSVFHAMLASTRVVRLSLPATGIFLLALVVLNQGLGLLWSSAPETSWLAAVGIFGHAFVSTAILAAMFFYYRGGLTYIQFVRREMQQRV